MINIQKIVQYNASEIGLRTRHCKILSNFILENDDTNMKCSTLAHCIARILDEIEKAAESIETAAFDIKN